MKKLSLLLFCLALLTAACQKTQEPREAAAEEPVIFEQSSVDCQPITCERCLNAVINPSCCCTLTVIQSIQNPACIDLCGTSSPLMPLDCRRGCQIQPPAGCRPIGPIHEPGVMIPVGQSHVYCSAINHSYQVMNCGQRPVTIRIQCGQAPPINVVLNPGETRFFNTDSNCRTIPCPSIPPAG